MDDVLEKVAQLSDGAYVLVRMGRKNGSVSERVWKINVRCRGRDWTVTAKYSLHEALARALERLEQDQIRVSTWQTGVTSQRLE